MIGNKEELAAYLAECQEEGRTEIKCELSSAYSARVRDTALTKALVAGFPMAQGIQQRIIRSRGREVVLTAKVRYRDGVRLLAAWHSGSVLSAKEAAALETALSIAAQAKTAGTAEDRLTYLYGWVCRNIRYVHTSPGQKGYERLVSAVGVLQDGQANCQGFADVMYLLCGLCGIECQYRCGRGERRLHLWNAVCINGEWREVDASRGARAPQPSSAAAPQ